MRCTAAGPRIGANGVKVPSYLYKLVYDATTHKLSRSKGRVSGGVINRSFPTSLQPMRCWTL